ncbi:hypothetical protein M0R45_001116 [Rubus argutus]|uniref:Uncharacterized protein n=1 Tax=Rubus argutus TaxID=59490 RepID=A0AAW1VN72_RUBAR
MMMRGVSAAMCWHGWRRIATTFEGIGGIRKAAAAATLTSSRFSEIIRRNSTTLAASEEKSKKEGREFHTASLKEEKSLYLCFREFKLCNSAVHTIQSIRLNHVLSDIGGDVSSPPELKEVAYRSGPDVPYGVSSSVVGSKIVIFDGWVDFCGTDRNPVKEISEFETDPTLEEKPTLRPSPSPVFNKIATSIPDHTRPSLLEVDGKIYCFGFGRPYLSFKVFDPKQGQGQWLPLDLPPCIPAMAVPGFHWTHAVAGTNILLWGMNGFGVSRYDVAHPEKGWTRINSLDVARCLPRRLKYGHQILFVKLQKQHHGDDDCFLMFSCHANPDTETDTMQVFLLSHEFESLKPMQPLQLPPLPPEFWCPKRGCRFFHIGDQKIGLVFVGEQLEWDGSYVENVSVFVIAFEYEIITTHHDEESYSLDVKYKLLATRYLEYSPVERPEQEESPGGSDSSELIGAYVL